MGERQYQVDTPKHQDLPGWRRFIALQRNEMGPVEHSFFEEQHAHSIGTIRVSMILGMMLWIIASGMEYSRGVALATRLDLLWHAAIGVCLAGICVAYRKPLSSLRGHALLAMYSGTMSLGLMVALNSAPPRWPYALASLALLTVAVVALWTRLRWMFLGLVPLCLPIAIAAYRGLFPLNAIPLAAFYVVVAGMFGLLLRSGRIRPAFEVFVLRQHLMRKALLDPLTQIWNRAGWETRIEAMDVEDGSSVSTQSPSGCVLFMDLDHFKRINDRHGHDQGDIVLRAVAQTIADTLRSNDVFARIGGEEFSAWLSGIDMDQAEQVANRIRRRVASLKLVEGVTISIGLSCVQAGEDVKEAVRRSDEALLLAKKNGRDCVWKWQRVHETAPEKVI